MTYEVQTQQIQPLETIFEDQQEDHDATLQPSNHHGGRPKSQYGRASQNKASDADLFLSNLTKKRQDITKEAKLKAKLADDLNNVVDISQMSLWTGESVMLYPPGAKKAT